MSVRILGAGITDLIVSRFFKKDSVVEKINESSGLSKSILLDARISIRDYLNGLGIISIGRFAQTEYMNSDVCVARWRSLRK